MKHVREFETFHEAVEFFYQYKTLQQTHAEVVERVKKAVDEGRIVIKEVSDV